jgi:hypothetical protein
MMPTSQAEIPVRIAVTMNEKRVQMYYITRDGSHGKLSATCDLWYLKPVRNQRGGHIAWVAGNHPDNDSGHFGEYDVDVIVAWFGGVKPDTDREMVVIERGVTADQLSA